MLDLRSDHIDYVTDLLRPPEDGFRFERAVATTFSLDLAAVLAAVVPLAFGAAPETPDPDPLLVLRALRKIGSRLTVFYQAGQIPSPRKQSRAFQLLDRQLVPVCLPKPKIGGVRPAFHPKCWVVEYRNDAGESRFRFSVLSRNLTFDRSWDVAAAFESGSDRRQTKRTKPLIDFLETLGRRIPRGSSHSKNVEALRKGLASHPLALGNVAGPWTDFEILPLPAPKSFRDDPLFSSREPNAIERPIDAVLVSPFLSDSVIERIARRIQNDGEGAIALVTRPDSFLRLGSSEARSLPAWAFKDAAIASSAEGVADASERDFTGDLHAKFYFCRKRGESSLLLGSMNATESGLHRNVELMVRLRCSSYAVNGRKLLKELFGNDPEASENPFERIDPGKADPNADDELQRERDAAMAAIRDFCDAGASGRAIAAESGFVLELAVPPGYSPPDGGSCDIRPVSVCAASGKPVSPSVRFEGLSASELSEFFVLSVSMPSCKIERVVQLPVSGLEEAGRDEAVVREVVETNGGWLDYLDMLFSEDPVWTACERKRRLGPSTSPGVRSGGIPGFYEKMLRTAAGGESEAVFGEAERILAGQKGRDADALRVLIGRFREALGKRRGAT